MRKLGKIQIQIVKQIICHLGTEAQTPVWLGRITAEKLRNFRGNALPNKKEYLNLRY